MSGQQTKRKADVGVLLIVVGGVILLIAIWWLLATPDPLQAGREACEAVPGNAYVISGSRRSGYEGLCVLKGSTR